MKLLEVKAVVANNKNKNINTKSNNKKIIVSMENFFKDAELVWS